MRPIVPDVRGAAGLGRAASFKTKRPTPTITKTIAQVRRIRALRLRGTFLAVLAGCLAASLAAGRAAQPSVQALFNGKWPAVTRGWASDVKMAGNYAYVALVGGGLAVVDVSNPTTCVRVGGHATGGYALGVAVVENRVYLAQADHGLLVLPTLTNVHFTVRVDATPGETFTLEAATNLREPIAWTPLLTTNVPSMPFDYVDFDVRLSEKPQKFYRVRQP